MGRYSALSVVLAACGAWQPTEGSAKPDPKDLETDPALMSQAVLRRYCDTIEQVTWDTDCKKEGRLGCRAGGRHDECRFCGHDPLLPCEAVYDTPPTDPYLLSPDQLKMKCGTPTETVKWDETCLNGGVGCRAGGIFDECRFCGFSYFSDCKAVEVTRPTDPYLLSPDQLKITCGTPTQTVKWDETCLNGGVGCGAGGIFDECRYCGFSSFSDCKETTSSELSRNSEHSGHDELPEFYPGDDLNNEGTKISTGSANLEYDGDDELLELYPELEMDNEETNVAFKLGASPPKIAS